MAGRGPAPKDPSRRARANHDPIPQTILKFVPGEQPFLPADHDWHDQTVVWWRMWGESEIAKTFTAADWQFLLDTARLHTAFWNGALGAAPELRQRVAKFGATPEDRARLRIFFASADRGDADRTSETAPAPSQGFGNLRFTSTGDVVPLFPGAGTEDPGQT
jgi:hypothetical protein